MRAHQAYMGLLASRFLQENSPQLLDRGLIVPTLLVKTSKPESEREVRLPQPSSVTFCPLLVAVSGQEVSSVEVQHCPIRRGLPATAGCRGSLLKGLHV